MGYTYILHNSTKSFEGTGFVCSPGKIWQWSYTWAVHGPSQENGLGINDTKSVLNENGLPQSYITLNYSLNHLGSIWYGSEPSDVFEGKRHGVQT